MSIDRRHGSSLLRHLAVWGLVVPTLILVGCSVTATPATPTAVQVPTATPTATATPAPTWTPTPTPTATPDPPARLEVQWPASVSPLSPVPVEVRVAPPAGMTVEVTVRATVMDPEAQVYATFELTEREGDLYRAPDPLRLPLDPLPGYWWLIVNVTAPLPVVGDPALFFEIAPVVFRDLGETLPSEVIMRIPAEFDEVVALGDTWAGGRIWSHGEGEVALWWLPGPAKAFLLSNALVVLEATYAEDGRQNVAPSLSEALPVDWQGRPGFEFPEAWPAPEGGPGYAWVIQDSNYWLYVLRVRGVGTEGIPALHEEIVRTFRFVEASD